MTNNFILEVDSYKSSHFLQTPPGMQFMSAYIEPNKVDGARCGVCLDFVVQIHETQK